MALLAGEGKVDSLVNVLEWYWQQTGHPLDG